MAYADKRFVMHPQDESSDYFPKVVVFLAAYNGAHYLNQQLNSILWQVGVEVTIYVSVDKSLDGTELLVDHYTKKDNRVIALTYGEVFGGAAPNFYRLICEVDFSKFDFVSFSDQDDIWQKDKLIRHVELMQTNNVDGVSSNVVAFWPDGTVRLIDKSQPQRELDFIFESAGPGCTFLMTPWLVREVKKLLGDKSSVVNEVALHDWLVYAVCRASSKKWYIDSTPSLQYRQHNENVVGANSGIRPKLARLRKISNGWYRAEVLKILAVTYQLSNNPKLLTISRLLEKTNFLSRVKLLRFIPQARRKISDRIFLALMIVFGLF